MEQKALAGWIHVATFPERRRAWWGCYWETWSTPLTQHIATDETKRRIKKKINKKTAEFLSSPVRSPWLQQRRLPPASPRRLPLFQRSWRFALPCSLLLLLLAGLQQRSPTDQVIEQRPQSFLTEEFKSPPHRSRGRGDRGIETSDKNTANPQKNVADARTNASSDF